MTPRTIDRIASEESQRYTIKLASLLAVLVTVAGCASATPPPTTPNASAANTTQTGDAPLLSEGRTWTARFYARDTQAIWDKFSPNMQKRLKSKSDFDAFQHKVEMGLGKESKIVEEHVEHQGIVPVYVRTVVFERSADKFAVKIGFDAEGRIAGFRLAPAEEEHEAPSTHLDYVTHTELRLPFNGEWTVFWGGRTVAENHHVVVNNQRFAYDFDIQREGSSHKGKGEANTDYWCYGQPIVAPGAGKVAIVVDGIEDNVPGVMNPKQIIGNHVVIDHGQNEFSFLAHLQKGSLRVKTGDTVEAGTAIGACGNSGNSSEPHLHYHLQNSPVLADGDGLPAQFRDYTVDGKHVDRGEPTRSQHITQGHP